MTRTGTLDPTASRPQLGRRPPAADDPAHFLAAVARAVLEVEVGRRPLSQLEPVLSPAVLHRLSVRDDRVRRRARRRGEALVGPGAGAVVRVWSQQPADGVCEGGALVRHRDRILSLAMRAERCGDGWWIVDLARPEDGARPIRSTPGPVTPQVLTPRGSA